VVERELGETHCIAVFSIFLTDCSIFPFSASRIALLKLSVKRETASCLISVDHKLPVEQRVSFF